MPGNHPRQGFCTLPRLSTLGPRDASGATKASEMLSFLPWLHLRSRPPPQFAMQTFPENTLSQESQAHSMVTEDDFYTRKNVSHSASAVAAKACSDTVGSQHCINCTQDTSRSSHSILFDPKPSLQTSPLKSPGEPSKPWLLGPALD